MRLDLLTSTALGLYITTAMADAHLQDGIARQSSGPLKDIPMIGLGTWLSDKGKVCFVYCGRFMAKDGGGGRLCLR